MIIAVFALLGAADASWILDRLVFADNSPVNDPVTFFIGQGVLGVVAYMIYKEYKRKDDKLDTMQTKLINDIIPLLTRATEALERATGDGQRRRPQ